MSIEAMKQALEALDSGNPDIQLRAAITLRQAIEQAEQAQPIAWMYNGIRHDDTPHDRPSLIWRPEYMDVMSASKGAKATPLYTAPPPRQPLTEEFLRKIHHLDEFGLFCDYDEFEDIARAIEAAHGIKGEV